MSLKKKLSKRLISYARVSAKQQDLARQLKALKRAGCARIYSDTASGSSWNLPEIVRLRQNNGGASSTRRRLDILDRCDNTLTDREKVRRLPPSRASRALPKGVLAPPACSSFSPNIS